MSSTSPLRRSVGQVARAGEAVSRARLAVVPRLRSRAPRMPFVALVSLLLLGGVVGLLLFNTSMQQASFTASQLEEQADSLSAREQALVMELNQARNPQQLAMRACEIGMVAGSIPCGITPKTAHYRAVYFDQSGRQLVPGAS